MMTRATAMGMAALVLTFLSANDANAQSPKCGTADGKYDFSALSGQSFKTLEKQGGADAPTYYLSVCGASAQTCDVSCPFCVCILGLKSNIYSYI